MVVKIQFVETLNEFQILGKICRALTLSPFSISFCHWALSGGAIGRVAHQGKSSSEIVASEFDEFGRADASENEFEAFGGIEARNTWLFGRDWREIVERDIEDFTENSLDAGLIKVIKFCLNDGHRLCFK